MLRSTSRPVRRPSPSARPSLEKLEDRCLPAAVLTGVASPPLFPTQPVEGQAFSNLQFATVFDSDPTVVPSNFTVKISWGDGTALDTTTGSVTAISGSPQAFAVNGSHTFAEEAGSVVPPAAFPVSLTVTDTKNNVTTAVASSAFVADANLSQGNPVTGTPSVFLGGGTNQPSTASELQAFKSAIGGANNGATPAPQNGGFRVITWDGVKTDGTDSGGPPNTTVISSNTVGIPLNRFQPNGVFFGAVYAVGGTDANGNTFTTVNPSVAGLFPPFSPKNTFAMFNDNGIDFKFVVPSPGNSTVVAAASRGFGAVFVNVELPDTTTIQYFNGNTLLETVSAPVGGKGKPVFAGALFDSPIVTRVVLTLGTDVIFKFDGTSVTPGPFADNGVSHNLVVTDDWAFAEPVATANGLPIVTGAQGLKNAAVAVHPDQHVPFTGVVASFTDLDPAGNAKDFTATINWGDGHLTNGTIAANGKGGFDVIGTNTYATAGTFPINVDVADFGGGPGFAGSVPTVSINNTAQVGGRPETVGAFDPTSGTWYLDPQNGPGFPSPPAFSFGGPGFRPVPGDWNGDGVDTVGVFDPGTSPGDPNVATWFLRNENGGGAPDAGKFAYGTAGGIPVAGDWTGTGKEGIGVYDPATGTWFLRSSASAGAPDVGQFQFGLPGWIPVVGDWNGTGHTGIGVFDPSTGIWYLRNEASAGAPDAGTFAYGAPGTLPATGDWTGLGKTGIAVFANGTWFLRNEANAGFPDAGMFAFGAPGWLPVAGAYTLPPQHLLARSSLVGPVATLLTGNELHSAVTAALARLSSAGVDPAVVRHLASAQYSVATGLMPPGALALAYPDANRVLFSPEAAGYGWFGDPTPLSDGEFVGGTAVPGSPAAGHEDLLTAVLHEMGHLAGLGNTYGAAGGLMAAVLPPGVRRVDLLDQVFAEMASV